MLKMPGCDNVMFPVNDGETVEDLKAKILQNDKTRHLADHLFLQTRKKPLKRQLSSLELNCTKPLALVQYGGRFEFELVLR